MKIIIAVLIAIIIFLIILLFKLRPKKVGTININVSDPEKDVYSLNLEVPFGELDLHKEVRFAIRKE